MGMRRILGNVAQLLLLWPLVWLVLIIFNNISPELGENTLLEIIYNVPPFDKFAELVYESIQTITVEHYYFNFFKNIIQVFNDRLIESYIIALWIYIWTKVQKLILNPKLMPIIATFLGICSGWFTLYLTENIDAENQVGFYIDPDSNVVLTSVSLRTSYGNWIAFFLLLTAALLIGFFYCKKKNNGNIMCVLLKGVLIEGLKMGYSAIVMAIWVSTLISLNVDNISITLKCANCILSLAVLLIYFYIERFTDKE